MHCESPVELGALALLSGMLPRKCTHNYPVNTFKVTSCLRCAPMNVHVIIAHVCLEKPFRA